MTRFNERLESVGTVDAWHALSASAALPQPLQRAFSALDTSTRSIAAALRVSVASLGVARRIAASANLNPAEIAIREALSEIDTFLAQLTADGGPTVHILFVPVVRKKALPDAAVLSQPFRDSAASFLRGSSNRDAASLIAESMNQVAGVGGFMRSFFTSLSDGGDGARPVFPASYATAGVCIVAGGETYADLVVPARLLTGLFDARRARVPLLNHIEHVPQNVRVTPVPRAGASVNAVIRWDPVPPTNRVSVGLESVIHNEEIVVVCVEGPLEQGESFDWEVLFAGVTLPNDRGVLPTNTPGNARVVARLRNHGMTQSYTDVRELGAGVDRRYVVYLRQRQEVEEGEASRYFMSSPSGCVWLPRTSSASSRNTRGTPPDWYAVPSVMQALPPLSNALTSVRSQLSRAAAYTTVNTGTGQSIDRTISALERELTRKAAEASRITAVTSSLNALASSAAGVSTGLHTILLVSPTGGIAGWAAKLAQSLTDPSDPGRPQYSSSAPVTGVVLVAGAPRLPQLASVIALFKLLFGDKKRHRLLDAFENTNPPAAAPAPPPRPRTVRAFDRALRPVKTPQC